MRCYAGDSETTRYVLLQVKRRSRILSFVCIEHVVLIPLWGKPAHHDSFREQPLSACLWGIGSFGPVATTQVVL
jgi:hypothetical protein